MTGTFGAFRRTIRWFLILLVRVVAVDVAESVFGNCNRSRNKFNDAGPVSRLRIFIFSTYGFLRASASSPPLQRLSYPIYRPAVEQAISFSSLFPPLPISRTLFTD